MQCKKALDILSRYADSEADGCEAAEVKRHLDECRACRLAAESLTALQTVVSDSLQEDFRYPDLSKMIMSQLPTQKKSVYRHTWAWAVSAVVLIAVVISAYHWPVQSPSVTVSSKPTLMQPAPKMVNAKRQESPKAPTTRPRNLSPAAPQIAVRIRNRLKQHDVARTQKEMPPADNMRFSMDIAPIASADCSGMRIVTKVKIGDVSITQEHRQITEQKEPLPDAEKIERPPLEQAMSPVDPTPTM